MSPAFGSAQPLTARVPVPCTSDFPTGWAAVGDLRVGHQVYAVDGSPTTVTYLSAVADHDVLEVVFDDGQVVRCAPGHQWVVSSRRSRQAAARAAAPNGASSAHLERVHRLRVAAAAATFSDTPGATVEQLAAVCGLSVAVTHGFVSRARTSHRNVAAARVPLGRRATALRGEQGAGVQRLYAVDEFLTELANSLDAQGHESRGDVAPLHTVSTASEMAEHLDRSGAAEIGFAVDLPAPAGGRGVRLPVSPYLLGRLLSTSTSDWARIPATYLRAAASQRRELLRGMVDAQRGVHGETTGLTVAPQGLAVDVLELVRSLGVKAHRGGGHVDFTLTGLRGPGEQPQPARDRRLNVLAVRAGGQPVPGRSLQVAHPAHLYLTGGFIPTHNEVQLATGIGPLAAFAGRPAQV